MGPASYRRTRPPPQIRSCSSPSTAAISINRSSPSSSRSALTSNAADIVPPDGPAPLVLSARARTACSSRSCSRCSAAEGASLIPVAVSRPVMLRNATRLACRSPSSTGRTGGTAKALARHRSLQASSSRGRPSRSACRWPSIASSAPCRLDRARSSDEPRALRCSSITSRPRRQAPRSRRESPAISARSASACHPTARDNAGPRWRWRPAAARYSSAVVIRPMASAIRPASSSASVSSGERRLASSRTLRRAARSSAASGGPTAKAALS